MERHKPPRLEKNGNGVYHVIYSKHRRSARLSLRTRDPHKAEQRFIDWMEVRDRGGDARTDPRCHDILTQWFDQWITGRMTAEARYPSVISNLSRFFGDRKVSQITRADSKEYIELRRKGKIGTCPASDSTIRMELQKLRAAFRFMVERVEPREHRIQPNLIPYIELPEASPPRERILSSEEWQRVSESALQDGDPRWSRIGRFILIAMETAQRKNAILELRWEQVDMEGGLIVFLPYGQNQTSKRRPSLPISDLLMRGLKRMSEERINSKVVDSHTDIWYPFKSFMENLGIEGVTPHTLRHTWATHAAQDGLQMETIAAFMGDTVQTVIKNYLHLSPDHLRQAINRPNRDASRSFLPPLPSA
jgi:integrase